MGLLLLRVDRPWTAVGILAAAVLIGLLLHGLLFGLMSVLGRRVPPVLAFRWALLRRMRGPVRLLLPLLGLELALPEVALRAEVRMLLREVLYVLWVIAAAWVLAASIGLFKDLSERRLDLTARDNLRARQVRTQTELLYRVAVVGVVVLAVAAMLLRFEAFRTLGAGLLASAGVVGVIVGIAAQRPLGNLLAGVQLALTQPVRVDDVVVIQGEWGRIEEVTLTYVVVHLWDERKLVLPISYFMENPFENWTRTSADLLGTVYLHVDHSAPVRELRRELEQIVRGSAYWDGRVCRLHVTEAGERTLELRALVSAPDADSSWELRCEVREKLIAYLQQTHPGALPKLRTDAVAGGLAF
jgi:small-conductance mechanosensitive channel